MKKIKLKRVGIIILILSLLFTLTACVPGNGTYTLDEPATFFSGIWHGWIAPISLIISILQEKIRIYEPINTGLGYDFGFYMAIISGFGGLSFSRKKKKD